MHSIGYGSRRKFVISGLVTVAGVGLSGCGGGGSPGSVVVAAPSGGATAAPATPLIASEVSEWEKLVGSSFLITTESGKTLTKLAALERVSPDPNRPPTLARHNPFYAYFEMEARLAPVGGKTYPVSHPTKGDFELFLGQPTPGKGVVVAVLA